jgi:hypothetical protein
VIERAESGLLGAEKVVFRDETIRHDEGVLVTNDDRVRVEADESVVFDGWVRLNEPQGVAKEGIAYTAYGPRWRLENEVCVRVNGSYAYTYNPNSGRDSRAPEGGWLGRWTVGEVIVDLLEHALGIPESGSAIPLHHSGSEDVYDVYMTSDLISGYDAETILSFTTRVTEFDVQGMRFGDALTLLLQQEGQVGWYIDPDTKELRFVWLGAGATVSLSAGEIGHHADELGKGYEVEDNPLRMSLEEVYTKIIIQGRNKTVEIRPEGMPGGRPQTPLGNARLEKGWDPSLETSWRWEDWRAGHYNGDNRYEWVWRRYVAAPVEQRVWRLGMMQDDNGIPYGTGTWLCGVVFHGAEQGPKTRVFAERVIYYEYGVVLFLRPYLPPSGEGLWAWYRCEQPFVVTLGPAGSAYTNYGLISEMVIYDEGFEHKTSRLPTRGSYYSIFGGRDDTGHMLQVAQRLLSVYGSERIYGAVVLDGISPGRFAPGTRVNFAHLQKWSNVGLDVMQTICEPQTETTRLLVGNDIVRFFFAGVRRDANQLRMVYEQSVWRSKIRWLGNQMPVNVKIAGG